MQDFDMENQLAQQRYQQALAAQQKAGQMPQGKMVGNQYVRAHPMQYLSEMLRSYNVGQEKRGAEQELKDLSGKRQTALTEALRKNNEYMTGAPAVAPKTTATEMPTFDDADAATMGGIQGYGATTGGQAAVAPDPYKAASALIESNIPALQTAGINQQMELQKQRLAQAQQQQFMGILQKAQSPQQALQAGVPYEMVKNYTEAKNLGREKVEFKDTGGQLVPVTQYGETPTNVQPLTKTGNPYSDLVINQNGQMVPNAPLVAVKGQIAQKGATNVNVNADKSYFANVAEGIAKQDVATLDAGRGAPKAIETARSIKTLLADPALITGTGANARLSLNKAFQTAGLIDGKTVANTEQLGSLLANQTLSAIKSSGLGAGNGFTNTDREFLEKASSGQITMDVNTLRRIADMNERTGLAAIDKSNSIIRNLNKSGKMGNVPMSEIEIPAIQGFRIIRD